MSSGSDCVCEESLWQNFRGRTGLKKKSMFTAYGRAPPGTRILESRSSFSFR